MKKGAGRWLVCVLVAGVYPVVAMSAGDSAPNSRLLLKEGWGVQSSEKVTQAGKVVSTARFKPRGWYSTSVPSTVLAALVENKVYSDIFLGMNLRSIPGTTYPIGENFSNLPMPPDSPFRAAWWYRTEFRLPADYRGKQIWLHFGGINFRASIWLNGRQIADFKSVAGAYRVYEFNVTDRARPGQTNTLAVEVFPPQHNDLAITWVDWNPMPPDKNMGLWRDVYVTTSGPVALRYPHVITRLEMPSIEAAHLTVTAELRNATKRAVKGILRGQIENIQFAQEVELAPNESRPVTFTPDKFPQLNIANPRLWWPAQVGPQNLYGLKMEFETNGQISDRQEIQFGIREVTSEFTEKGHRVFKINGQPILVRGAGWAPDMLLRSTPERQEAEVRYVKDMNLNTIRLEGKIEDDHFLNLCDRYGILLLPGWCCCDHWERWRNWKEEDYTIAAESLRSQILRLRSHPSVFNWLNGSDNPPPRKVEEMYIKILKDLQWPNPYQSSATGKPAELTGPTGLKMTGPYEYIGPSYWLTDTKRGGAFGFNTETGPGPAIPPLESLRKMLPADHLWPIDDYWNFHAGGGEFKDVKVFTEALNARYGQPPNLEDYLMKAQLMTYEGERAMFEAFGRNKYTATGVIQWMLNNAWPSMIWHLYDYYLRPAGGYFGTKKACEPLHVQYSYDDRSVVLVNSYYEQFRDMKVSAAVHNLDLTEKFSAAVTLDIPPDSSTRVFNIPEVPGLTTTYFLKLTLKDRSGKPVSSNCYWLSTKPEIHDWDKSTWYYTPIKSFADFTGLKALPAVELRFSSKSEAANGEGTTRVSLENPSQQLAFFVRLKATKGQGGEEVLPVLWEDNYFSLMPGEKREISATYRTADLQGAQPVVEVAGWNVTAKLQ